MSFICSLVCPMERWYLSYENWNGPVELLQKCMNNEISAHVSVLLKNICVSHIVPLVKNIPLVSAQCNVGIRSSMIQEHYTWYWKMVSFDFHRDAMNFIIASGIIPSSEWEIANWNNFKTWKRFLNSLMSKLRTRKRTSGGEFFFHRSSKRGSKNPSGLLHENECLFSFPDSMLSQLQMTPLYQNLNSWAHTLLVCLSVSLFLVCWR